MVKLVIDKGGEGEGFEMEIHIFGMEYRVSKSVNKPLS